jgi:hypothetical protein
LFLPLAVSLPRLVESVGNTWLLVATIITQPVVWLAITFPLVRLGSASATSLVLAHLAAMVVMIAVATALAKPSFRQPRESIASLVRMNRQYGIHQYQAKVVTIASSQLVSVVLIPRISGTTEYGFFAIALLLASPPFMTLQAAFKVRARQVGVRRAFTKNELLASVALGALVAMAVLAVHRFVLVILLGQQFLPVSRWVPALLFASVVQAATLPFTYAISGWSDPKYKRVTIGNGVVGLVLHAALILSFGVAGAVHALVLQRCFSLFTMAWYYSQNVKAWSHNVDAA